MLGSAGVGSLSLISNSSERSEVQPSLVAFTLYLPTGSPVILPPATTEAALTVLLVLADSTMV